MMRTRLNPGRALLWGVWPISGIREKGINIKLKHSYQEPAQVPLGEKPKVSRINLVEGIRQIGPVPLVEGVPAIVVKQLIAGCNN